jgi:hypothetical protein
MEEARAYVSGGCEREWMRMRVLRMVRSWMRLRSWMDGDVREYGGAWMEDDVRAD